MQLIQNGTQAGTSPPAPAAAVGTPGYINNAPPGAGVTPTTVDPDVNNALIGEMANLVTGLGVVLAPGTFTQALQAMRRLAAGNVTSVTAAGATALTPDNAGIVAVNAAAGNVTLTLPLAASAGGAPLAFTVVRTDTTTNTVAVALGAGDTLLLGGGTGPLSVGNNQTLRLHGDGVSHWLVLARPGVQVFSSSGTFTVPAGCPNARVLVCGGGGGSWGSSSGLSAAGAGGGGWATKFITGLVPGTQIAVTVGAGGSGGAVGAAGGTGGTSSFGAYASATGGAPNVYQQNAGPPGSGSGGDVNGSGGWGGLPGGMAAGAYSTAVGGSGGSSFFAGIFTGNVGAVSAGFPASGFGTGAPGPGAGGYAGVAGIGGVVIVEYWP